MPAIVHLKLEVAICDFQFDRHFPVRLLPRLFALKLRDWNLGGPVLRSQIVILKTASSSPDNQEMKSAGGIDRCAGRVYNE